MIKKGMHYICVIISSALWCAILALIFQQLFLLIYNINLLSPKTYKMFVAFWNSGGVLHGRDIMMILGLVLYVPICAYGCWKLYNYKYMRLLTVPLNWLANIGMKNYQIKEVTIKNLKVEEKKTLDQIVKERLEKEKKKSQDQNVSSTDLRKKIIEQIGENKK